MKIEIPVDCGNSPRKNFIKEFNLAFAKGDIDFILEHVDDEIVWEMVGETTLLGKDSISSFLREVTKEKTDSLKIQSIITHGRDASSNGTITSINGKTVAFCDVYKFKNLKNNILKKIQSYGVQL
jgi:hypothetical protein